MHVFQGFGLALWDEAHRVGADYFSQSCYRIPARLRLGVSATPDRRDGKTQVIEAHIGKVKVSSTRATTTPKVLLKTSPWQIPLVKVKDKDGNLVTAQMPHSPMNCGHVIRMLSRHHGRNEMIRNFVTAAYKKGRVTLVQSDRLEHLEQLTAMFVGNGIPASDIGHYASGLTTSERELIKKKRIIVATYQMTAEATDIPELDTLVMGTPKSDVIQIVGRILREHPDKKDPLVFDIVDDSSSLFTGYARNRQKWYKEIGAPIDRL